ncbi:hypothetical protein RRF57_005883 [Xylaria bambusicola]|uniref:Uncharacterized protein n=1 Tax=Xylaria bambusicola TaxID=326684 RepID=A0AAN7UPH0_9PEZI
MTKALADFLAGDDGVENVHVQQLSTVVDLLVSISTSQNEVIAKITRLPVSDIEMARITGVISLFAPYIELDSAGRQRSNMRKTQITLRPCHSTASGSLDATILHQSRTLSNSASAHVVLFTTSADTTPKTIIGGYFPTSTERGAHVLFQLRPVFCLLRSTKPKMSLADLVKTEGKLPSAQIKGSELSSSPCWISDRMAPGAGIRIDPEKRTVTLARGTGGCYTDVQFPNEEGSAGEDGGLTIQDARMDVFVVVGAGVD